MYKIHGIRDAANEDHGLRAAGSVHEGQLASPAWKFDDRTFDRSAVAFDNPDHVSIVIHNYRWRLGLAEGGVDLGPDDLVFITIGSLTENSDSGDHQTPAKLNQGPAPAWDLWRRIAAKDPAFGRPDVFGAHIAQTKWASATITTLDARIPQYIRKIAKRAPQPHITHTSHIRSHHRGLSTQCRQHGHGRICAQIRCPCSRTIHWADSLR